MQRWILPLLLLISSCTLHKKTQSGLHQKEAELALTQTVGYSSRELKKTPLLKFITEWYGTPYRYGHCEKKGIDCSCFCKLLYESVYAQTLPRTVSELHSASNKISLRKLKEGDLVFFNLNASHPDHVGIYLKEGYFIHASSSKGVMVSSLKSEYYKKGFYSAGRFKSE